MTYIEGAQDGDLAALVYRHDDGGWVAEVQERQLGRWSLRKDGVNEYVQLARTRRGARLLARRLLRLARRVEEARKSLHDPELVATHRRDGVLD